MFSLKSERSIKFYTDHPNLDFEAVNLIFIDLLEKLINNMNNTLSENLSIDILKELSSNIINIEKKIDEDNKLLKTIQDNTKTDISTLKTNIDNSISSQKEYIITSIRDIFKNKDNDNTQFIHKLISDNHLLLEEKITKHLDNIPKELQNLTISKTDFCNELQKTHLSIGKELNNFISSQQSKESIADNISSVIDTKYNEFNSSITARVETLLSSSITTNNSNLTNILDRLKPMKSIEEYFVTNNNSNIKGKRGETKLEPILSSILPNANIINSSGVSESGDFIIERNDKPTILIDTKDYNTSIPKKEVDKIIRDIEKKKCNGILISQNSGVSLKYDFEINIHNNFIIIFLHNVKYNEDKISIAIQIIDMLFPIVQQQHNMEHETISSEQLNLINKEFQEIIKQKKIIIEKIEQHNKDIIKEVSKIDIPTLSSILTSKFSQSEKINYICDICNNYSGKNTRALAAHKRGCQKKLNEL